MSSGILYRALHGPTSVTSACCIRTDDGQAVLQLQDTQLTCWRPSGEGLEQTATWRAPASMLQMVHLPGNYLLLLAEGGHCYLHAWQQQQQHAAPALLAHAQLQVPLDSSCSQVQPFGCIISSNVLSAAAESGVVSLTAVAYLPGVLHLVKATPVSGDASSAAAGSMHLQTKAMALNHALLSCHYPGGDPPALGSVRVSSRVLGLTWLSPQEQQLDLQGRSLLAVLHELTVGSQPPVLHVDCVAVNWQDGSISPGPWSLRNVHPTTRLLQPFAGSDQLPPGILAISSRGVLLCTCLGSSLKQQQQQRDKQQPGQATSSSAAMQAAGAGASKLLGGLLCVAQQEVVQWTLGGLPLSCSSLSDSCYVVGDSRAGLYLLQLQQAGDAAAAWTQLQPSGCLAIPDLLLHVPLALEQQQQQQQDDTEQEQQLAGLLLVSSKCSSSQVVGLTQSFWKQLTANKQPHAVQQQQQAQPWPLPILQPALQPSLAGAQAVAVYQDSSGALPEQQLLVACGVAPRGKLAAVRSGCGLLPTMLDGPELPGDAELFAIPQTQPCQHATQAQDQGQAQLQQQPQGQHHSMLGFSFPSAGSSSVMSLEGHTFRQLQLAGLSQAEPSLLMTSAPGGWVLQVTSSGVRVLAASLGWQLHSQWMPTGGSISLAAAWGSHVVVACGAHLTLLVVSCCQGTLQVAATGELQQQASALSLFKLQDGQLVVAAGLWVDNSVVLMTAPAQAGAAQPAQLQVTCSVDLDADQPRSIALLPVGPADVLLVGSNTGKVLLWQVCSSATQQHLRPGDSAISLQHGRAVQVSNTSVSLQRSWLPGARAAPQHSSSSSAAGPAGRDRQPTVPCVVARAGALAIFRPNTALLAAEQQSQTASSAAGAAEPEPRAATVCVEVSRLCGSEACLGAAPVHTPDMPHSLAWVSHAHRLCFGSMGAEHKLRWRSCGLAGTPLAVAVHQQSDTIVLLLAADAFAAAGATADGAAGRQQPQQQLVVLDARSLRVLLALSLAPGHTYTMLQVLDLPAISQQQDLQQQQQCTGPSSLGSFLPRGSSSGGAGAAVSSSGGAAAQPASNPGCLPFIVLGSHAVLAAADTGPAASRQAAAGSAAAPRVQRVGMLSFFELRKAVMQAQGGSQQQQQQQLPGWSAATHELRYELVLHGMVPLQVTPASACTVVLALLQHPQQQGQQQPGASSHAAGSEAGAAPAASAARSAGAAAPAAAAAAAAQEPPLLVVGSEKGVTLLRVAVDDAALADKHHLQQLLAQAAQAPDSTDSMPAAAAAQSAAHLRRDAVQACRVSVQELSSALPLFQGVVTKLSSSGDCIVALESLGPVTAFRALCVQPGGWVQLLGVGMDDRSRCMAVDFVLPPPAGSLGEHSSSVATGTGSSGGGVEQQGMVEQHGAVLVAAHPAGLLLLQRDLQQESRRVQDMLQAAQAAWEAGQRPPDATQQGRGILMVEPPQPAQPWQGAGEAAPWGGGLREAERVQLQQLGQLLGLRGDAAEDGGDGQVDAVLQQDVHALVQRHLAAAAGAAAGVGQEADGVQCVRPDWLGLMNPSPGLAPAMLPSASCAPAPGSMLLCQAQLGLHTLPLGDRNRPCGSLLQRQPVQGSGPGGTVLCLSSSGAVTAAQLLPPQQLTALQRWQSGAALEPGAVAQLLPWRQWGSQQGANGGVLFAERLAAAVLRNLPEPEAAASYEGHERAPGALAGSLSNRLASGPDAPQQGQQQDEEGTPVGVVDGGVLFMGVAQGRGDVEAAALQHLLWQQAL